MLCWHILRNTDRYPGLGTAFPDIVACYGTKDQALTLAKTMSNHYAGCDYIFYVVGVDDF